MNLPTNLPADLPENWSQGQTVSPNGTEVGLTQKHGYNYLMQQVNAAQEAVNNVTQQNIRNLISPLPVENGGTGATSASKAFQELAADFGYAQIVKKGAYDMDLLTTNGMYSVNYEIDADPEVYHMPEKYAHLTWYNVLVMGAHHRLTQVAVYGFRNTDGGGRMWVRYKHDDYWSPWYEIYTSKSLVHPFAQTQKKEYRITTQMQPGWYTLASFDSHIASAVIRLDAIESWEEGLWIFVDSNYFSKNSPTINIIGNTYTTRFTKFRCNCNSSGSTGAFTLDAYVTPVQNTHKLTMTVYQNSVGKVSLPEALTLSETGTERAVVEHRAPCGFEGSYMVRKQEVTLLNGWTLSDGNAVIYQMGRLCFFSMTIKGGTAGVGEYIFRLPTGTTPSVEEPVTNIIRRGTQMNYNIGVRTDNTVRFSLLPQPAYKAEDELTITAVWEAK